MKRLFRLAAVMVWLLILGIGVSAEEIHTELSSAEEFSEWSQSDFSVMSTLNFVRRVGVIGGASKTMYFSLMEIDGTLVYCIEPSIYAATGQNYEVDWGKIDEWTKERLFRITNVGYGYPGHSDDRWFMATQLAVWRALGYWDLYAKGFDGSIIDLSWEISEIERMADSFGNTSSFSGKTIELDLDEPCTIKDTHGVLSRFKVDSVKGVDIQQNGNELTLTIVDQDYQKTISDSKGITTGGLVYVHPGKQSVYMVHRSEEPVSYHLNLKLKTKNLKIIKQDKEGNTASGIHTFVLSDELGNPVLDSLVVEHGVLEIKDALVKGKYLLKETGTSFPYVLSEEVLPIELNDESDYEVVFQNDIELIDVEVVKKDAQTDELLEGAQFEVHVQHHSEPDEVLKGSTVNGLWNFQVPYGRSIKVCEVKAPYGYELSQESCRTLTIAPDKKETVQIEFTNRKKEVPLWIVKKDADTKELLEGAVFEVTTSKGTSSVVSTKEKTVISGLEFGEHVRVCEVKAPQGYEISSQPCQSILLNDDMEILEFENMKRRISLQIVKVDAQTSMKLDGAEFIVSAADDAGNWQQIYQSKTGGQRIYVQDEKKVTLYADHQMQRMLGEFEVDEMGYVNLHDGFYEKEVFVSDKTGEAVGYPVLDFTGRIELPLLTYGQKLNICEVSAPQGYEINEIGCQLVEVTSEDEWMEIVFENSKRQIDVQLIKHDSSDLKLLLDDAYFEIENDATGEFISAMSGRLVVQTHDDHNHPISTWFQVYRDEQCTELLFEAESDEQGEWIGQCDESEVYVVWQNHKKHHRIERGSVILENVQYGDVLTVCEVIAPTGYQMSESCHRVEVKTEEDTLFYFIPNERISVYDEVPTMGID